MQTEDGIRNKTRDRIGNIPIWTEDKRDGIGNIPIQTERRTIDKQFTIIESIRYYLNKYMTNIIYGIINLY